MRRPEFISLVGVMAAAWPLEMYRDMGLGEIGHLLSCQRDATFCEGYDKRLKLTRTQTIMQGASYCDFNYKLDGPSSN